MIETSQQPSCAAEEQRSAVLESQDVVGSVNIAIAHVAILTSSRRHVWKLSISSFFFPTSATSSESLLLTWSSSILEKNRSALKKTLFGAKYLVFDPFKNYEEKPNVYSWKANQKFKWRQLLPAVAVYAGINLNFTDNPFNYAPVTVEESKISPKAMVIAQNQFGSRWVLVTNVAYNKIGTDFASIDYILTLTRGFNKKWSGFIENQGFMGDYYSDGIIRAGAAYLFNKDMQIDASIGKNIKDTPNIITGGIGFSWRFANNYQEVKIEKDNGSKMDKKMKKKGEKEAKKRKDAVE